MKAEAHLNSLSIRALSRVGMPIATIGKPPPIRLPARALNAFLIGNIDPHHRSDSKLSVSGDN